MAKKFPIRPLHPERVCWGCDTYCPADSLKCGNGTLRTEHPAELFGDDWMEWGADGRPPEAADEATAEGAPAAAESLSRRSPNTPGS